MKRDDAKACSQVSLLAFTCASSSKMPAKPMTLLMYPASTTALRNYVKTCALPSRKKEAIGVGGIWPVISRRWYEAYTRSAVELRACY